LRTEGFSAEADGHTFMAIIVVDVLWWRMILGLYSDGHFKICNQARCQINQQPDIIVSVAAPRVRNYSWNDERTEIVAIITCFAEMADVTCRSVHVIDIVLTVATLQLKLERHLPFRLWDDASVLLYGTLTVAVANGRKWLFWTNRAISSADLTIKLYQSNFRSNLRRDW
jgi:hypothetical protein